MATITKNFSETMGLSDRLAKTRTLVRSDAAAPKDTPSKQQQKTKTDTTGLVGSNIANKTSGISDDVGLTDRFVALPDTFRTYDTVGLTDTAVAQLAIELLVTPLDGAGLVALELKLAEFYGFTKFTIERVNSATGDVSVVRGGEYQTVDVNRLDFVIYDSECPLSTYEDYGPAIYYIASGYVTTPEGTIDHTYDVQYTTDSFNLHENAKGVWIKNPGINFGIPNNNNKFLMDHMENWTYQTRVLAATNVLGRRCPVIVTDVMGGRTGVMHIASYPEAETVYGYAWQRADLLNLIADGETLFFQTTPDTGIDDFFFKITGDIVEEQLNSGYPITPDRIWSIPFTEVDPPEENVVSADQSTQTWLEVAQNYISWQSVLDSRDTWQELLIDG